MGYVVGRNYRDWCGQSGKLKTEDVAISRQSYRLLTGVNTDSLERPLKAYYDAKRELTMLNDVFSLTLQSDEELHRMWEAANEKTDLFSGMLRLYLHAVQAEGDPAKVLLEYTWGVKAVTEISTLLATSVMLQKARLGNRTAEFKKRELIEAIFADAHKGWPKECKYCL